MKWLLQWRSLPLFQQPIVGGAVLIFIILIFLSFGLLVHHSHKEMPVNVVSGSTLLQQLKQLETTLTQLSHTLQSSNHDSVASTHTILQQLQTVQSDLKTVSTHQDTHAIQQLLITENHTLSQQFATLQTQVAQIKKQVTPTAYLSISALPFVVIGVDRWNGEAQATIKIQGTADLMARNETRAGWTLMDLTFEPAQAIFKNYKNQLVKVTLN